MYKYFLILLFLTGTVHAAEPPQRWLFVSVIDKVPVLSSREEIHKLIDLASRAGIKVLFVQIYRANLAWFPSTMADTTPYERCFKNVGTDAFALLIKKAHARGIKVHAWLNLLTLSKNAQAPLLRKYGPGILTRDLQPKKTIEDYKIDDQYFLEPGDLRVRQELGNMVEEILTRYPQLDGLQFDYIRYPDSHPFYGYTSANMRRFKEATGMRAIDDKSDLWQNWKRSQVTELLTTLIKKARSVRPRIHISTTGCMSYSRAYHEAFQDWAAWVNTGLVEFVTVMSYPDNVAEFQKNIADIKKRIPDLKKVALGVGAYKLVSSPIIFTRQFDLCETSGPLACAVFHYGNLGQSPAMTAYLTNPRPAQE